MIRKQVYIEAGHEQLLKRSAAALGVSEAELVRQGIELVVAQQRSASKGMISTPLAEAAWREIEAVLEQRKRTSAPQTGRQWTRDELYEERIGRLPH